ncbi:GSU2403 family nucleotidyltransferase fold protein [Comamonas testosteroni]|uniref:GSU2403 family nucleotidyltransferase fold protein n=1 Tax=Comamonas testosteroni TaxID=285 RepID=UPI00391889E3
MNDQQSFARLLTAIHPWRDQLILIGGWCHRLHRLHENALQQDYPVVHTRDTDLLIKERPAAGENILAQLENLGFRAVMGGDQAPPATHYYLGEEGIGFYAEFLLPWKAQRNPTPTENIAGVVAQQVKRVDVLMLDPWIVRVGQTDDFKLDVPTDVLVANPLSFLVQKFLIKQDRRSNDKRAQDLLYVHDTLQLFPHLFDEFHESWTTVIAPALTNKNVTTIKEEWQNSFVGEGNIATMAAAIGQERNLTAQGIQDVLRYGYSEII